MKINTKGFDISVFCTDFFISFVILLLLAHFLFQSLVLLVLTCMCSSVAIATVSWSYISSTSPGETTTVTTIKIGLRVQETTICSLLCFTSQELLSQCDLYAESTCPMMVSNIFTGKDDNIKDANHAVCEIGFVRYQIESIIISFIVSAVFATIINGVALMLIWLPSQIRFPFFLLILYKLDIFLKS
jgi:hypothetical protein